MIQVREAVSRHTRRHEVDDDGGTTRFGVVIEVTGTGIEASYGGRVGWEEYLGEREACRDRAESLAAQLAELVHGWLKENGYE